MTNRTLLRSICIGLLAAVPTDVCAQVRNGRATPQATVQISGASVSEIDVRPGFYGDLVITGSNLNHLRRASVQRNGRSVSHINAQFVGNVDPTHRRVRLTATKGAAGPVNVPLDLVLHGRTGTPHSTPVEVYVAMPNLKIAEVTHHGNLVSGDDNRITVLIGSYARVDPIFPSGVAVIEVDASPLAPAFVHAFADTAFRYGGTSLEIPVPGRLPYGTFTWKVRLDPGNLLAEEDETDNEMTITVSTEQLALPDLQITAVDTEPSAPKQLELYDLKVTIRNVGYGEYHIGEFQPRIIPVDCAATFSGVPRNASRMPAGTSRVLTMKAQPPLTVRGWHECTFRFDADYPETSTTNNEFTARWYVNR